MRAWIRHWVEDHLAFEAEMVRRWQRHDLDHTRPLTSGAVVSALPAETCIGPYVAEYIAITALPASLAPAEALARDVYRTGWRPARAEGPTRDDNVALAEAAQDGSVTG